MLSSLFLLLFLLAVGCCCLCRRVACLLARHWYVGLPAAQLSPILHLCCPPAADYMHTPLPVDDTTLHDLGFEALPYLGINAVSEIMVYVGE